MKKPLSILILALVSYFSSSATTYYFAANGNDANNGTSTTTPWKTLTKLNSFFSSLKAGDNVLFNRGDVFYGTIIINKNGSSTSPITISAYGSGANPVITGFTTVSSWTNLGSNIWESTSTVSSLTTCNMVSINGAVATMGRYPNTGYLTYQSFSGNSSITSSSIGTTNWTGAEAVIKKNDYTLDRCIVTKQSGSVITYTDSYGTGNATAGYGFFIQNDIRTLDNQNEWFYNASTKKIRVYSTIAPTNVQVASLSNIVYNQNFSYVTLDNITFTGSSSDAIYSASTTNNFIVQNSAISFSGGSGVVFSLGYNCLINNNIITDCNSNGIESDAGSGFIITNNSLRNIGINVGQGLGRKSGIFAASQNVVIKYNSVVKSSYIGINLNPAVGTGLVQYNFVDSAGLVLDDGAGIYTGSPSQGGGVRTIDHNIVLNTLGNRDGTSVTTRSLSSGIYCDDLSSYITVTNNSVSNGINDGFKFHRLSNCTIYSNTAYNNKSAQALYQNNSSTSDIHSNIQKNNIYFSKAYSASTNYQLTVSFASDVNDISNFFTTSDSNYFARPINSATTLNINQPNTYLNVSLASWQSFSGEDAHSKNSPINITDTSKLKFVYNATSSNKTISLGATYIDVKNVTYNGSITLAPYTSAVLIMTGTLTNTAPVANAGADQSINLPTATITLTGSGTDANGTIASYNWTKISGPTLFTITNSALASTTVTALVQGTYLFQLKVTDNSGATGLDTVQITVNAVSSLLPAVNPANTVNGLNYKYYQSSGSYSALPNFITATPTSTGTIASFSLSPETRATNIAFNYTGYISVPTDGQYTFYAVSDDGSNIYIDNVLVVNNDGVHGYLVKTGTIGLQAGKHAISVGYFNNTGTSIFQISYEGPGVAKNYVPATSLYRVSTGVGLNLNNDNISSLDIAQPIIKAYPNPFINSINVDLQGNAGDYKLTLVDVIGRVIWSKAGVKNSGLYRELINTSSLQRGIYLLNMIQNGKSSVIKIEK